MLKAKKGRGMQVKKAKKLIALIVSIGILGGITGCGLISKTPEGEKKTVVAKINSDKITKGEFDKMLPFEMMNYGYKYDKAFLEDKANAEVVNQIKEGLLDKMVQQKVMLQKAKEMKITADAAKVETEVNDLIANAIKNVGDETKYKEQLAQINITPEDYKAFIKDSVESNMILEQLYNSITKDIVVTDEDAKKYYDEHPYDYTEKPNMLKGVSHILVKTDKEASDIKARLDKGEKFEDLAKQLSQDPGTKDKGGLLGDIAYNDQNYVQEFIKGAILVPEGKVSAPVQSQYGFHLIKVEKKETYPAVPFDKVKEDIKKMNLEEKKSETFQNSVKDWESKAKIKKYTEKL